MEYGAFHHQCPLRSYTLQYYPMYANVRNSDDAIHQRRALLTPPARLVHGGARQQTITPETQGQLGVGVLRAARR